MAFFLIPLGIAVNFVGGFIINLLKLPIYLDALGSMVIGALCGPIYGIITAVATGLLLQSLTTNLYYLVTTSSLAFSPVFLGAWATSQSGGNLSFTASSSVWSAALPSLVTVAVFGGYSASATGLITGFLHKTFASQFLRQT